MKNEGRLASIQHFFLTTQAMHKINRICVYVNVCKT
jgi:hypothetical protein